MQESLEKLITIPELAKKLRVTKAVCYGLTNARNPAGLPIFGRFGRRLYFAEQDVMNWMKGRAKLSNC